MVACSKIIFCGKIVFVAKSYLWQNHICDKMIFCSKTYFVAKSSFVAKSNLVGKLYFVGKPYSVAKSYIIWQHYGILWQNMVKDTFLPQKLQLFSMIFWGKSIILPQNNLKLDRYKDNHNRNNICGRICGNMVKTYSPRKTNIISSIF